MPLPTIIAVVTAVLAATISYAIILIAPQTLALVLSSTLHITIAFIIILNALADARATRKSRTGGKQK